MPTTLQQNVQSIPRTIVRRYFDAARLPLSIAESVLRRGDSAAEWAPTLAFESVEANVKQAVGNLLRDEELTREGRLAQAKVAELRKAAELEATAAQARAKADADFRARVEAGEERREQVEAEAAARESALEQQKAARKRQVEADARRAADEAAAVDAAQRRAVTARERSARKVKVAAEQEALADQRRAVEATETVVELDQALQTTKALRKQR